MNVDGMWHIAIDSPAGKQHFNLELAADGAKLTGTATAPEAGMSGAITDGAIDGEELTWKIKVTKPIGMTLTFTATVDGDTLSGKAKAGLFGSFAVTGQRA